MGADSDNETSKGKHIEPTAKNDVESTEKKLPYPKSVFFIVTNEFCERFSYYGMKAVLTLYLKNVLKYSDDTATIIYHIFSMCCYFTPLFGAMIADSLLGKFRTIFYLSVVYACGNIILALAATPPIHIPPIPFSMIGLALIAIGTGGIKPCVAAFGGDQFILPQQAAQLASFFSFFYMSINSGSLISTFVTPILRKDVTCFDQETCYSLAFAIPAGLMVVSLIVFLIGKPLYRMTKPSGNVVLKVFKCIFHAIGQKRKSKAKREHWLDNADDVYEPRFIEDVKIVLRVLVLYLPLPLFWALFDQQGSRWTLQATRMNGVTFGYTIKPDQVQVLNPLLILLFIPLFDKIIYPLLGKCRLLKRPLHRLTAGLFLAGVAFIASGLVELELEKTYPNRLESNEANLHFVNTLPCNISLQLMEGDKVFRDSVNVPSFGAYVFETVPAGMYGFPKTMAGAPYTVYVKDDEFVGTECEGFNIINDKPLVAQKPKYELENPNREEEKDAGGSFTYVIAQNATGHVNLAFTEESDERAKPEEGEPKVKFIIPDDDEFFKDKVVYLDDPGKNSYRFKFHENLNASGYYTEKIDVEPKTLKFSIIKDQDTVDEVVQLDNVELKLGGSYLISISRAKRDGTPLPEKPSKEAFKVLLHTITAESSVHMVWLLPQYIIMTAGEIMYSITGLEFSYSQSPVSMKSVLQAAWLLTVAFGNLIDVIVAALKFFPEQSKEFFLFAGLMFVDMFWFMFMAWRYVPAVLEDPNKKPSVDNGTHEDKDS